MKTAAKFLIYGLVDPRDLLIHYVGLSSAGMSRPRSHYGDYGDLHHPKCKWIRSLRFSNLAYSITVLERPGEENLQDAERWWIAYGKALGWPLTNVYASGAGGPHFTVEEWRKQRGTYRGAAQTTFCARRDHKSLREPKPSDPVHAGAEKTARKKENNAKKLWDAWKKANRITRF